MSQRHLYGIDYQEFNPPEEWQNLVIQSTSRDNALERVDFDQELNFSGAIAKYVIDEYLPTYGAANGLHYRIEVQSDKTDVVEVVFDGYIDLLRWTLNSRESYQFIAPIKSFIRTATVLDRLSIVTQGFLFDNGHILSSDFINVPVVRESKTLREDRELFLRNLSQEVVSMLLSLVQEILSAVSDIIGVSAPIGVIELATGLIGAGLKMQNILDLIVAHRDLLFPIKSYYKALSIATTIEKTFAYLGYEVEFGEIDEDLNKMVLMPSQNEFNGYNSDSFMGATNGILKPNDFGYFITDLLVFVEQFFNTRQAIEDNTIHIKSKKDPFWNDAAGLVPLPILNETTKQYSNGSKGNDLDDFYATWYASFKIDNADPWTLTEKNGDSYEIHRKLINELDVRTNCLSGLKDLQFPYAMAVRKDEFTPLWEQLLDVVGLSSVYVEKVKDVVSDMIVYISDALGDKFGDIADDIEALTGFNVLNPLSFSYDVEGCLKMQDNITSVPKLVYLESVGMTTSGLPDYRIPVNFKDFIGAKNSYNYYLIDSPADVNSYLGQRTSVDNWEIKFDVDDYNKTKTNDNTLFEGKIAKFTDIEWSIDEYKSITNLKVQEVFDDNITETEITQP